MVGLDMTKNRIFRIFALLIFLSTPFAATFAQPPKEDKDKTKVRTMTIPISIFTKQEIKQGQTEETVNVDQMIVKEDNDEQEILSIRSYSTTPLSLAVLIQDDLTTNFNLQIKDIASFIKALPKGSRVMVAYLRAGSLQVRQKFTEDLDKAAGALRIVSGSSTTAPRDPYDGLIDALNRFDALPLGRRAVLMVSDGVDASQGFANSSPTQSLDLDRAILRAQRKSVAVYSFYSPTSLTENANSALILNGQGSLQKLSEETGGRAFFQGTIAPISFDSFFEDMSRLLNRQFALTYLSTHMKKGYHKVEVNSTNPEVKIEHPKSYYYRKPGF
jgi:VWFA-related protein